MQKVIVKSRISVCAKKASVGELQPPLFAEPLTTSHLRWMSQLFCPRKKESKITIIQLHSSSQEFICIVKRHKILRFYKSYCLLLKKNFGVKLWTQHFLPNCNWILNFFSDFARIGLWCQCRLVGARCPHVWNDGRSTSFRGWQWGWPLRVHFTWRCPLPSLVVQRGCLGSQRGNFPRFFQRSLRFVIFCLLYSLCRKMYRSDWDALLRTEAKRPSSITFSSRTSNGRISRIARSNLHSDPKL